MWNNSQFIDMYFTFMSLPPNNKTHDSHDEWQINQLKNNSFKVRNNKIGDFPASFGRIT